MLNERNIKLYLDTSIINFAVSEQGVAQEKEVTLQLFEQIRRGRFEAGISEVVLREISRAPEKKIQALMEVLKKTPLTNLSVSEDAERLADKYVEEEIIPRKYREDALHIAMAAVYEYDVVVSWNFEHMVKVKTRREVQGVNIMMGYKSIDIATPAEVIDYD